ncbi:MAG: hypothetical protein JWM89_3436 [Acidimicrobiales bacterium]|nr:hypothetical protein [Acidimicrobiales bacterium]
MTREWTRTQLIDEAEKRDFALSNRQITDWVEKGLLDKPRRRGTGRGSKLAVWSDNQVEMLFSILDKHRTVKKAPRLADLPVGAWLGWGEDYVSLVQVRRAMRTWAGANSDSLVGRIRQSVDLLLKDFDAKPAVRRELRETLTDLLVGISDEGQLLARRDAIAAALRKAQGATRSDLVLPKVDAYLTVVEARIAGTTPFRNGTDASVFPDATFRRAWTLHNISNAEYARKSGLPSAAVIQELFDAACQRFAALLGYSLISNHPDWTNP